MRLISYYPNSKIISYPDELENYLKISIPVVKSLEEINNPLLKELYLLVNDRLVNNDFIHKKSK